ncbi:MAG TPA: ROK family protein, partial [Verrucomicrobiae bacterium]
MSLWLNPRMLLGIEIGGTKLQIVHGDDYGNILKKSRCDVDKKAGAKSIRESIRKTIELVGSREAAGKFALPNEPIQAAAIGFGGPVDWRTGRVCCSHQIEGWEEFELGQWLQDLMGAAVAVENDANTACLGEALRGAGQGRNPVFYVTLGSGVGGGLVVDGKVYHGAMPGEAEIGHVRLDRSGAIVEERCSGWAVDRRIREAIKDSKGKLAELCRGMNAGEARHLSAALVADDPLAAKILKDTAEDLAFALSHVVHLCHPEVIVIGGGLSLVGEPLRA